LLDVRVEPLDGMMDGALLRDDPHRVVLSFRVQEEQLGLDAAIYITNARGTRILDEVLSDSLEERFPIGDHEVTLELPPVLNVGEYTVGVWLGTSTVDLLNEPAAAAFELVGSSRSRLDRAVVLDLPFRRSR
jgi:ABC-2 type transport system ATP-binding protein/lipopolysaccharide transport system ATP-binding protein